MEVRVVRAVCVLPVFDTQSVAERFCQLRECYFVGAFALRSDGSPRLGRGLNNPGYAITLGGYDRVQWMHHSKAPRIERCDRRKKIAVPCANDHGRRGGRWPRVAR